VLTVQVVAGFEPFSVVPIGSNRSRTLRSPVHSDRARVRWGQVRIAPRRTAETLLSPGRL